ncbi:MAG: cache domain-containing protein [Bacteroidales bacterium]|nr:cache domain-containing protein [Bacteroidales bacterium]
MKSRQLFNKGYTGWIVIALAIVMLYLSYFFIYIPQQETKLQQRSFRILKEYGSNMHDKYNYYKKHVENYNIFYLIYSTLKYGSKRERVKNINNFKSKFPSIYKVIESLDEDVVSELYFTEKGKPLPYDYDSTRNRYYVNYYYDYYTLSDMFYEAYQQSSEFKNYIETDSLFLDNLLWKWDTIVQKVPFSNLMEGLKFDKLLDNILLFDRESVIYNTKLAVVFDITDPGTLIDSTNSWRKQGGVFETIEVQGEKKHIMILPVKFLGRQMYLAGLITDQDYRKKTRAINNQLLIIISGIILLLLIGIPVLKVILINRQERLHAGDSTSTTLSLLIGVGLLLLIVFSALRHFIIDPELLKSRIEKVSDTVYSNFHKDIESIVNLYSSIIDTTNPNSTELSRYVHYEFIHGEKFREIPEEYLKRQIPVNEILLIDSTGDVAKAVTETAFSDLVQIDLSERLYFKNAFNTKNGWYNKEKKEWYYIESIKSYNTGYQETAVSFHLSDSMKKIFNAPVLAITSPIPSLYHQVLNRDNQFLIINEQGNVLFHSVKSKNLHENFLDESNRNPQLEGAIENRVAETMEITYNEKQWLARVIPVQDAPLYHITLIDLDQTRNKNARIFLFTFYLLVFTFLCIYLGILIMQKIKPRERFIKINSWSLKWLFYDTLNYFRYRELTIIQSILLLLQLTGLLLHLKPVTMMVYQLIFIGYSGYASLVILGNNKKPLRNFLRKSHFSSILILVIVALLIFLAAKLQDLQVLFIIIAIAVLTIAIEFYNPTDYTESSKSAKIKYVYQFYMFIWLISLTVVPALLSYNSVKNQEEYLWRKDRLEYIAFQNLLLKKEFGGQNKGAWYHRIQGNGIDRLKISDCTYEDLMVNNAGNQLTMADSIYARFRDPVTGGEDLSTLMKKESYNLEWVSKDFMIYYSKAGINGCIQVISDDEEHIHPVGFILYLIVPVLLVILLVWFLFRYLSDYILNTIQHMWVVPETPSWETLLQQHEINRVIVSTFNPDRYLNEANDLIKAGKIKKASSKSTLLIIDASRIANEDLKLTDAELKNSEILWIVGLDNYLHQIDNHEKIIRNLQFINQKAYGKVIIALPFELDLIRELYDDFIADNEVDKEEKAKIYALKRSFKHTFKNYHKFTGSIHAAMKDESLIEKIGLIHADQKHSFDDKSVDTSLENNHLEEIKIIVSENQVLGIQHEMELRYYHIWNNLSSMERLVLYDIADDGMLNMKNKYLINRLLLKGLIIMEPYPKLFSESFNHFIKFSIKVDEANLLEQKLVGKGKWKNMRYLILLILMPLAAFIFIAQGSSIEKVIGIFTGALALFSGLMRLFDSGVTRQSG